MARLLPTNSDDSTEEEGKHNRMSGLSYYQFDITCIEDCIKYVDQKNKRLKWRQ